MSLGWALRRSCIDLVLCLLPAKRGPPVAELINSYSMSVNSCTMSVNLCSMSVNLCSMSVNLCNMNVNSCNMSET